MKGLPPTELLPHPSIRQLESGSMMIGGGLARGCIHCREGSKMVLLVTGLCGVGCFYCPLSEKKQGKDVVFANELFIGEPTADELLDEAQLEAMLEEAKSIDAHGTGITGGDPFLVPGRTLQIIGSLKRNFGKEHHIHLYTACSGRDPVGIVKRLADAGLDEIRFHIPRMVQTGGKRGPDATGTPAIRDKILAHIPEMAQTEGCLESDTVGIPAILETVLDCLETARSVGMDAGVEIPMLPGDENAVRELAPALAAAGAMFINLNELEFSETNYRALLDHGYDVVNDISSAATGSRASAEALLRECAARPLPVPGVFTIHFCSSSYKDAVQLRKRILRRAKHVATGACEISEDGLLIKGVIEFTPGFALDNGDGGIGTSTVKRNSAERSDAGDASVETMASLARALMEYYEIPHELVQVDHRECRIEMAPFVLEEIVPDIRENGLPRLHAEDGGMSYHLLGAGDLRFAVIEEYPTADRLEVEREYL